ncbi:hypothetical protein NC652_017506 [Populus alba x Populus x berolinensis]|nr:hypothetical protein NC652_017506 [Populus alba x Populus x berolinensis]
MPSFGVVECEGEARADKKTSYDSAALAMLNELQKRGQFSVDPFLMNHESVIQIEIFLQNNSEWAFVMLS